MAIASVAHVILSAQNVFSFTDLLKHLLCGIILSAVIAGINAKCVMYDVCSRRGQHDLNCVVDHEGIVLNDAEAEEIMERRCTDFYSNGNRL